VFDVGAEGKKKQAASGPAQEERRKKTTCASGSIEKEFVLRRRPLNARE
jgi:hypothetical protein